MPKPGTYCKAYYVDRLREFDGWSGAARPLSVDAAKRKYLYLQHTFIVTEDILVDESVVFDDVTPGWIDFCRRVLEFEVPEHLPPKPKQTPEPGEAHAAQRDGERPSDSTPASSRRGLA